MISLFSLVRACVNSPSSAEAVCSTDLLVAFSVLSVDDANDHREDDAAAGGSAEGASS